MLVCYNFDNVLISRERKFLKENIKGTMHQNNIRTTICPFEDYIKERYCSFSGSGSEINANNDMSRYPFSFFTAYMLSPLR